MWRRSRGDLSGDAGAAARDLDDMVARNNIQPVFNWLNVMESIAAFDAKTRLSELLDRASKGEVFEITKHGRPVGKLGPPDGVPSVQAIADAVSRLREFRGAFGAASVAELRALIHDGHRF
jgi:prevent-host-death family protein